MVESKIIILCNYFDHNAFDRTNLRQREAEVAVLVTEGNTHREVGSTLFISPKTVEHHVAKIRQKLGVSTRAEMMATVRQATSGTND